MKLCQIWLERERQKLGLKAVRRGKQTRAGGEEIKVDFVEERVCFTGLYVQFYMSA